MGSAGLDAAGVDVATLTGRIADKVRATLAGTDRRPVLARLPLMATCALHGTLLGDTDNLAAECRNAAIEEGAALWVEEVRVRTCPATLATDDMLAALRAAFKAGLDDPTLVKALLEDLASCVRGCLRPRGPCLNSPRMPKVCAILRRTRGRSQQTHLPQQTPDEAPPPRLVALRSSLRRCAQLPRRRLAVRRARRRRSRQVHGPCGHSGCTVRVRSSHGFRFPARRAATSGRLCAFSERQDGR